MHIAWQRKYRIPKKYNPKEIITVLDEIASALIDQDMISELVKPRDIYCHGAIKQMIEDVAQSSVMRLDPVSMDRLWDLITMVFKWQLTMTQDIMKVTVRHLYEIETFTMNPDTQLQLHRVQNVIDNFTKILSNDEKQTLTDSIMHWMRNYNIRVSLLLKLGFQNQDGSFKLNDFELKYQRMLENIGENIYAATITYNLSKAKDINTQKGQSEKHELNMMINQLLGDDNKTENVRENAQFFKLSLCDKYDYDKAESEKPKTSEVYSEINVRNDVSTLQGIFDDVSTNDDSVTNIHDELLNIIDKDC